MVRKGKTFREISKRLSDICPQVRPRSLVYDPFVGTGSILVAAAHYGAHTLGADIDARVICLGKVGVQSSRH